MTLLTQYMKKLKLLFILVLIIAFNCKKSYNPPTISSLNSFLVVEGVINSGSDSTFIKLSRTVNLSSKTTIKPELMAKVSVESENNNSYILTETSKGYYVCAGLNLNNDLKYRLRIMAQNGEQYLSDFVPVLNSPPVDSVNYTVQNMGVSIFVNTHDPNNKTRYYRWDYNETWRFHSDFNSFFKSNGDTVLYRDLVNDQIYTCWHTDTSSTIVLANSARLGKDVIVNNPVNFIASTSIKLANEYSILVKQYALTADAYNFWQNLKKNTEQLGTIFDAQPSQISGNIHSIINKSQLVIGYVSVGSISSKRLFILNRNLPAWLPVQDIDTNTCNNKACFYKFYPPGSNIPVNQVNLYINYNRGAGANPLIPYAPIYVKQQPGVIVGFNAAEPICVDCTLRGTNKQPAYWKYE